jgi:hypothetical protein
MKREDDRILEFLESEGMATAKLVTREVFQSISVGHVRERLSYLEYAGLVFRVGIESYELTGAGQKYLCGEIDADHLPRPTCTSVMR